jgi:hypothetical protein
VLSILTVFGCSACCFCLYIAQSTGESLVNTRIEVRVLLAIFVCMQLM